MTLGIQKACSNRLQDEFVESKQIRIWNLGAQRLRTKVDITHLWQKHFYLENEMAQSHSVQLEDAAMSKGMRTQDGSPWR